MRLRKKRQSQEAAELNITAFMNLMVILVPFLLIMTVFSRMTVLELNLPALDALEQSADDEEVRLQLQLIVGERHLYLRDANVGLIQRIARTDDDAQWRTLRSLLVEVKGRFPEETAIALLLEPGISYNTMIQVMDRVASTQQVQVGTLEIVELFPDISLGDAPEELQGGQS
ncbi:ExbD/TolR family protein [Marinimicrobium alkaliphilum]|uniref:ExbD/TolR family protein n=1 Tax=Marinimicrobium alkaliphilum TaxID=2202654 RepID=UPI000DB8FA2A|nr:biopolymer transporter ExbD [Marinimicrobium alkaliphilum]